MDLTFDPHAHHEATKRKAGYQNRRQSNQQTYDAIGFMSGLEVHQQLLTKEKLFCHCPAGIYNKSSVYDAEVIRHMRPTLSELGEYDGTALMEFKTRKEIVYRLKNETACTYEVDDTPPFPVNREALDIAIEISLLSKFNIVGEVHITRKQYLDGSIPTGFQRTAIIGVEGEIELRNKKIRLIQLSMEEDSCREISDIGHTRIYKTDRLGMPLIETVTYPDCVNPDEVKEACDYIRFLNRSTGKVRTGIGSGRQDVNVSCRGGSRVEIKGVAHTKWIPELTHNEAFRQWSLLLLRDYLKQRVSPHDSWKISYQLITPDDDQFTYAPLAQAIAHKHEIILLRLPFFKGALSHFTQPGKMFANELSDRLKVIACIEKPNILHSESLQNELPQSEWKQLAKLSGSGQEDALLLIWGPPADIPTALETIEERCKMAFEGVPNETRKAFLDGTTIFERVLPGADRMYPDTDSAPIPLEDSHIDELRLNIPDDIIVRYKQLKAWEVPEDTYTYIFSKNLFPVLEEIVNELGYAPKMIGTFIGHRMKNLLGRAKNTRFKARKVFHLFAFLKVQELDPRLAWQILPLLVEHPRIDFESALTILKFKKLPAQEIISKLPYLYEKFTPNQKKQEPKHRKNWIMGQLRKVAVGNMDLSVLAKQIND
ncbi:MAG: Glu-tRNA(Gln) amidotransferase GatDE subunit E [Bacteroidetes bacterium HGW-Bacteroidetes-1]|jgi:glutamyl-tRNA(Gln) amidotransferase subunit E|nr:MAG: Glu-tRNA(Gln) amidotransferase GatDE subunit E [Bacteroidetes bacterium HGW-Bacteroidetes-1]